MDDDPLQANAATELLEHCEREREPAFLSNLVLCELVWVLDRSYRQTKSQICAALDLILEMEVFRFERESLIRQSLNRYRSGRGGFADFLISGIAAEAGCRDTVTFDRALKGLPGFVVL